MKSGFYPILNMIITNVAIISCLAPFFLVLWKKLQYQRTYTLIGIYWLVTGLLNQYNWVSDSDNYLLQALLMFFRNLFGIHVALIIFMVYSKEGKRKKIFYTLLAFISFELTMLIWNGMETRSNIIITGIGSLIVLIYSIVGLIEYIKEVYHSPFENTIAFINAAFLFAYGATVMLSTLNFFAIASPSDPNEFFLYYVGLLLSALLTCFGLWQYAETPSFYRNKKSQA
ncbi:MAG TPA: hypothetical protein VMT76_02880 [Puia sp.]|nr:hypothetical protein [Puia sp.]